MPQIVRDAVATSKRSPTAVSNRYENLFAEGGRYVFDGNRVIARFRVGRNGVGRWRLQTIDSGLSLVVTPDLRIRKYRRIEETCVVRIIRVFETVFDALKALEDAICDCAKHGHAWRSPAQPGAGNHAPYVWQWCVLCGAEQAWFPNNSEWLEWPADDDKIAARTAGALPRLHGPVVGGSR